MADFGDGVVIPPWLYQNDLPDDELQAVYVAEARKKADAIAGELRRLDQERLAVAAQLEAALAFLAEAEERLRHYQAQRERATATDATPAIFTPRRRSLPRPEKG